ncbi:MAG: hypothetical protein M1823_005174 [Watsoniomyces obsoletus]|nr:MAG: hypothetical protein M1823_005174 [Watsoniomyces obsoletus]
MATSKTTSSMAHQPIPTAADVTVLLRRLPEGDNDVRFMAISDLFDTLSRGAPSMIAHDHSLASRTVDGIVKCLKDSHDDIQNMAIKCMGPLSIKLPVGSLDPLIEKLCNLKSDSTEGRSSARSPALRTIVTSLPHSSSKAVTEEAYQAISRVLIPRLVGARGLPGMLARENGEIEPDVIDLAVEVARCFGPMLKELEVGALHTALHRLLLDDRVSPVVKKRTVIGLGVLATYLSDGLLSAAVSTLIEGLRGPHVTLTERRMLITLAGTMARAIPRRFGPYLRMLAPFILSPISHAEVDEQESRRIRGALGDTDDNDYDALREAALTTLESVLAVCPNDMMFYTKEILDATLLFAEYDPSKTDTEMPDADADSDADIDDVADDDVEMDVELEEEGELGDEDTSSWRLRRGAVKALHTLIITRPTRDLFVGGTLYDEIAPVLLRRFIDGEEDVRTEVLATLGSIIRKTREHVLSTTRVGQAGQTTADAPVTRSTPIIAPSSRKRRRDSDASMGKHTAAWGPASPEGEERIATPPSGPLASLAAISTRIVNEALVNLEFGSSPMKMAAMGLLKELMAARPHAVSAQLRDLIHHIAAMIQSTGQDTSGAGQMSWTLLRIEALTLFLALVHSQPRGALLPWLDKILPAIREAISDPTVKVALEALKATGEIIKILTQRRSLKPGLAELAALDKLLTKLADLAQATQADTQVRQCAVRTLGTLLARTSGSEAVHSLPPRTRSAMLDLLCTRLQHETTQMDAVCAVEEVVRHSTTKQDLPHAWTRKVVMNLTELLRKASRTLRLSTLDALKAIMLNPMAFSSLDWSNGLTVPLEGAIVPLLDSSEERVLVSVLWIFERLVKKGGYDELSDPTVEALTSVIASAEQGPVFGPLMELLSTIGRRKLGRPLLESVWDRLNDIEDMDTLGKLVGNLMVCQGKSIGHTLGELQERLEEDDTDDKERCFILAVLGEIYFRDRDLSDKEWKTIESRLKFSTDTVSMAAAVALGRAFCGNLSTEGLEIIRAHLSDNDIPRSLLLYSIQEIVSHLEKVGLDGAEEISEHLWTALPGMMDAEVDRALVAECMGRLLTMDPLNKLPTLPNMLTEGLEHNIYPAMLIDDPETSSEHVKMQARRRGVTIQAFRYAMAEWADDLPGYPPLILAAMIAALNDPWLENAQLAMTAFAVGVAHHPCTILPELEQLLPTVLKNAAIRPELIKEVTMGPFKHNVDKGLELRKTTFESIYFVIGDMVDRKNVDDFFERILNGLTDDHDIRMLSNMILTKLIRFVPDATQRYLDAMAKGFRVTLSWKSNDKTLKQEREKARDAMNAVLRVSLQLDREFPQVQAKKDEHPEWNEYWEWVKREFPGKLKEAEKVLAMKADEDPDRFSPLPW